jgi:methylmalonyl-CoA mutase
MEAFERIRDRADAFEAREGRLPRCALVSLGPRSEHRARAEWTAGALAAGGFEIVEGVEGEDKGEVMVACGKDDRYPEEVPELKARADAAGVPLVVAGRPPDDAAWAEGVLRLNVKTDLVQLFDALYEEVSP